MRWNQLSEWIPFVLAREAERPLFLYEELGIACLQPGKYASETRGGDFLVTYHGLGPRHQEKFDLIEAFLATGQSAVRLRNDLRSVIHDGTCPIVVAERSPIVGAIAFRHLEIAWAGTLALFQAIALAESRRYFTAERGGGKYLPFNFGRLILGGWATSAEVAEYEKDGLPGLAALEHHLSDRVDPRSRVRWTSTCWSTDNWGGRDG